MIVPKIPTVVIGYILNALKKNLHSPRNLTLVDPSDKHICWNPFFGTSMSKDKVIMKICGKQVRINVFHFYKTKFLILEPHVVHCQSKFLIYRVSSSNRQNGFAANRIYSAISEMKNVRTRFFIIGFPFTKIAAKHVLSVLRPCFVIATHAKKGNWEPT